MSPKETLVKETREWLERARADLDACAALISAGLPAEALFHAQQCAEKAIKAVLTWHQVSFRKTHDLDELKQVCLPLAGNAGVHLAGIEGLSQYAWRFHYPGASYSPERTEAEVARHAADRLLNAVAAQLESQFGD
jgi:HEPN domain-containing protein